MTSANRNRDIRVVGGGIGGLTAAIAFARSGAHVTLYERATALTEVGAGLQISPNGHRVLAALGLAPDLARAGIAAQAAVPMDGLGGRRIARFDMDGRAYTFIHRARLIDMLAKAARDAGVTIRTGAEVTGLTPDGAITFADGTGASGTLTVSADGLRSIGRPALNGAATPFFTGQVAWRAIVPRYAPPEARIWMLPGRHVVTYPLGDDRLNVVAVQEREAWAEEGWAHADDPANLIAAFPDACAELRDILGAVDEVHLWGLFRHPVAPQWTGAGLALLGDAAHPTLPFLAQGANLAIEDAFVLARTCGADPSLARALAVYAALRRPRVTRAIAAANANAARYHLSGWRRKVAHAGLTVIGRVAPGAFLDRLGWLYDHDVTA